MFIGHFAAGFAARRVAENSNLGVLMAAALLPDLIWPVLLLAGIERVEILPGNTALSPLAFTYYPYSHSLLAAAFWSLAAGLAYGVFTKYRTGAVVVALAVASHWFLDALVHRPDLPLYPGTSTVVGLGLWNSLPVSIALEGLMFVAAAGWYAAGTRARRRGGRLGLWLFLGVLAMLYIGSVTGAPPPSSKAVAWVGLATCMFPVWAAWIDRRRARLQPTLASRVARTL